MKGTSMDEFRSEVIEIQGKPVEKKGKPEKKKKKSWLFHRRPDKPVTQKSEPLQATEKSAASASQYSESSWVKRALEGSLRVATYARQETAAAKKAKREQVSAAKRAKRVNAAKARLGLEHPDA